MKKRSKIREKLDDYDSPVDVGLWDDISGKLDKITQKEIIFNRYLRFSNAFSLSILILFFLLLFTDRQKNDLNNFNKQSLGFYEDRDSSSILKGTKLFNSTDKLLSSTGEVLDSSLKSNYDKEIKEVKDVSVPKTEKQVGIQSPSISRQINQFSLSNLNLDPQSNGVSDSLIRLNESDNTMGNFEKRSTTEVISLPHIATLELHPRILDIEPPIEAHSFTGKNKQESNYDTHEPRKPKYSLELQSLLSYNRFKPNVNDERDINEDMSSAIKPTGFIFGLTKTSEFSKLWSLSYGLTFQWQQHDYEVQTRIAEDYSFRKVGPNEFELNPILSEENQTLTENQTEIGVQATLNKQINFFLADQIGIGVRVRKDVSFSRSILYSMHGSFEKSLGFRRLPLSLSGSYIYDFNYTHFSHNLFSIQNHLFLLGISYKF